MGSNLWDKSVLNLTYGKTDHISYSSKAKLKSNLYEIF